MAIRQTVLETTDVTLEATAQAHLEGVLDTYNALKFELDALQHQIDIEKLAMRSLLESAGLKKLKIGDQTISIVEGTTSKLDKVKFVAAGGSLAMLEGATVTKPKKSYLEVRGKGEEGEGEKGE